MVSFQDWFPLSIVGITFTTLAAAKFYGLRKHIVGGRGKCAKDKLVGACPAWSHKAQILAPWISVLIGLTPLTVLAFEIYGSLK